MSISRRIGATFVIQTNNTFQRISRHVTSAGKVALRVLVTPSRNLVPGLREKRVRKWGSKVYIHTSSYGPRCLCLKVVWVEDGSSFWPFLSTTNGKPHTGLEACSFSAEWSRRSFGSHVCMCESM